MKFSRMKVLENYYYVGFDEQGYTFIGTPNGEKTEINKWFDDNEYVENACELEDIKTSFAQYLNKEIKEMKFKIHLIGTDFQKSVWQELVKIPYGETKSYLEVAICMGDKNKVRAVASAIAKNPLLIIIPCHRVLGKDGNLRGFRAGLPFKRELLQLENHSLLF